MDDAAPRQGAGCSCARSTAQGLQSVLHLVRTHRLTADHLCVWLLTEEGYTHRKVKSSALTGLTEPRWPRSVQLQKASISLSEGVPE